MKRQSINKIGNNSLITEVITMKTTIGKYPVCRIQSYENGSDNKSINGSFESIQFIPKNHGGAGLSIRSLKENKAGRFTESFLEIGKRDTEILIDFLKAHLESLGEYSGYESKETDNENSI